VRLGVGDKTVEIGPVVLAECGVDLRPTGVRIPQAKAPERHGWPRQIGAAEVHPHEGERGLASAPFSRRGSRCSGRRLGAVGMATAASSTAATRTEATRAGAATSDQASERDLAEEVKKTC